MQGDAKTQQKAGRRKRAYGTTGDQLKGTEWLAKPLCLSVPNSSHWRPRDPEVLMSLWDNIHKFQSQFEPLIAYLIWMMRTASISMSQNANQRKNAWNLHLCLFGQSTHFVDLLLQHFQAGWQRFVDCLSNHLFQVKLKENHHNLTYWQLPIVQRWWSKFWKTRNSIWSYLGRRYAYWRYGSC